jgi:glutathione S-transferase
MLKLYFAPRTRAVRVRWLLEELGLPHELARVEFNRPSHTFAQSTPLGKLPVIEDGDTTIGESGAIVEYIIERSRRSGSSAGGSRAGTISSGPTSRPPTS